MAFPAAGVYVAGMLSTPLTTALNDQLAATKLCLGGTASSELTIASGAVAATGPVHTLDTEADAAADDLTNITIAAVFNGNFIFVRQENAARFVTLKHEAGGAGQMSLRGDADLKFTSTEQWVLFYVDTPSTPDTLIEVLRGGFDEERVLVKTADYTMTEADSGTTFTNEGAAGTVIISLPSARKGLSVRGIVMEAQILRFLAAAGDKIRDGTSLGAAAGNIQADAAGEMIRLVCVNAEQWVKVEKDGTWTLA